MTAVTAIADTLKNIVAEAFSTVVLATGDMPEQVALGKSLPAGTRPPCVLILAGEETCTDSTLTRRRQFHLVLIDRLNGSGDARATALWTKFDALLALFPAEGTQSGEVVFLPESSRMLECTDGRAAACLTVAAVFPS